MTCKVQVAKAPGLHRSRFISLSKGSPHAAGFDLRAAMYSKWGVRIDPGERALVNTGIHLAIPYGYEGQIRPRSGLAMNHGVTILNSPGTIDPDYRGEVSVLLVNHGTETFFVQNGDRIAQLVFARVASAEFEEVAWSPEWEDGTERGSGGFGSTGVK